MCPDAQLNQEDLLAFLYSLHYRLHTGLNSAVICFPDIKINFSSIASNNVREEGHSHSCLLKQMATALQAKPSLTSSVAVRNSSPAGMEKRRRSRKISSLVG